MLSRIGIALVLAAGIALVPFAPARAQNISLDDISSAVVHIKTHINPDGRTNQNLGNDREGSAIVIDQNGLVLTIGYLMVEAYAAEVITKSGRVVPANIIGYDHETGFGLLRAIEPLKIKPLAFGSSAALKASDPVLIAAFNGMVAPASVVARREFAGSWEYLLDDAIFTSPPHPAWSGAALIGRDGKLIGVGSLILPDTGRGEPGNMFVPIDKLLPVLGELLDKGRADGEKRPWLGVNSSMVGDRIMVMRVTPAGPAEKAGIVRGDVIRGIAGESVGDLGDFYRKVWARGRAGTTVPLDIVRDGAEKRIDVPSMNRLDHLKLKSTF